LRDIGVESVVFTTEWAASWFFNTPGMVQSKAPQMVDGAIVASVSGNFLERAERIATAIRGAGTDIAFYHANFTEQITTRVASFRPTPVQIHVAHDGEMPPSLFDGYIHLTKRGAETMNHRSEPCAWISASSDIAERLQALPKNLRQLMGIDAARTVSATMEDLQYAAEPRFLEMLTRIMNAFPTHFHIFAGAGEVRNIRAHLHADGVLSRVRFLAASDTESVLAATDVCFEPGKSSNPQLVLDAMAAGRPVVTLDDCQSAQRLLADATYRAECSDSARKRFLEEFDASLLGNRYMEFVNKILASGVVQEPPSRVARAKPKVAPAKKQKQKQK
jgi:hypothetical protein